MEVKSTHAIESSLPFFMTLKVQFCGDYIIDLYHLFIQGPRIFTWFYIYRFYPFYSPFIPLFYHPYLRCLAGLVDSKTYYVWVDLRPIQAVSTCLDKEEG